MNLDWILRQLLRFTVWATVVLNNVLNRRQIRRRRSQVQRMVNYGMLCSLEQPGTLCTPTDHHPLCYYARNPTGMLPPRKK